MRKVTIALTAVFLTIMVYSQENELRDKLYKLERSIVMGERPALEQLATYLDDTTFIQEFLGYHLYPSSARNIAIRVIEENCLFVPEEFVVDSTISAGKFTDLLKQQGFSFDELTGTFLRTKISDRQTRYELKQIDSFESNRLDTTGRDSAYPEWYYENQIDGFLTTKSPEALKWIASAWFKHRSRFNSYYFNDGEFLNLIKKLTRIEIGVPGDNGEITFLYQNDYYAKAKLNYLIYWTNHYSDYEWNGEKQYFENKKEQPQHKLKEEILFGLLNSEDDSVAINAYQQLTELDTGRVKALAREYDINHVDYNFELPTFLYRFLRQTVQLTQYLRDQKVNYKADGWLMDSLVRLRHELPYTSRYTLENHLIQRLSLQDVTVVEYNGLIYEKEWELTYSIGRILDKFYSTKWNELASDKKHLSIYLKKSKLFDEIGIIGICNKYLRKFENCSPEILTALKEISEETNDLDVKQQITRILAFVGTTKHSTGGMHKNWKGSDEHYGVKNLRLEFRLIQVSKKERDDKENEIQELFGKISYQQLGEAIKILRPDTLLETYDKFHFIESDFGISIDIDDPGEIAKFLANYYSKSEKELYEYYFRKTGIGCLDKKGELNFQAVYEVLKYDVVDAFVGGGGGRREEGIYMLIKLLEFRFKTSLGFPRKLCSWQGIYACSCDDRAKAWMNFLVQNGFVVPDKTEPPSISYND